VIILWIVFRLFFASGLDTTAVSTHEFHLIIACILPKRLGPFLLDITRTLYSTIFTSSSQKDINSLAAFASLISTVKSLAPLVGDRGIA
jgi:hypothetical protein